MYSGNGYVAGRQFKINRGRLFVRAKINKMRGEYLGDAFF